MMNISIKWEKPIYDQMRLRNLGLNENPVSLPGTLDDVNNANISKEGSWDEVFSSLVARS